jgi:hypothetical protein
MPTPTSYSFTRYLAAKKSVDDRALNRQVWQSVVDALPAATPGNPLQILEVGAGIGTMVERLLAHRTLTDVAYTAIDAAPENIAEAYQRLSRWAAAQGFAVRQDSQGRMWLQRRDQNISVELEAIDVFRFIAREHGQRTWDLLVAQAFLDLMDVPSTLSALFSVLRPGGLFYFPITFDGMTSFQPEIDPAFDATIEAFYHQTMDQRTVGGKRSGDSRTGRHLFDHLRAAGAAVLDVGSSDWVVFAGLQGYPADEAYFLHFLIHTIETALAGHPHLEAACFAAWIAQRHAQVEQRAAQVEQRALIYMAHQLDFLGCVPAPIPAIEAVRR